MPTPVSSKKAQVSTSAKKPMASNSKKANDANSERLVATVWGVVVGLIALMF